MPLPSPNKGEKEKDFINRCMSDPVMKRDYPKKAGEKRAEQRLAVCYQQWEDRNKKAQGNTALKRVPAAAFNLSIAPDACQFEAVEGQPRRVHMLALTGKPVQHGYWGNLIFDLGGLKAQKKKIGGLLGHDPDKRITVWDKFDVTDDGLAVEGAFLDNALAREVQADCDAGFPWEGSIHFIREFTTIEELGAGATTVVNGFQFDGPGYVMRDSVIDEISLCVHATDRDTNVAALGADNDQVDVEVLLIEAKGDENMPDELTADEKREHALEYVGSLTAEGLAELPGVAELREAGLEAGRESERTRVKACADVFADDPAFALKTYLAGGDLKDARVEHAEARMRAAEEAAKKAEAQIPGTGQDAAGFVASDSEEALAAKKEKAEAEAGDEDPKAAFIARRDELVKSGLSVEASIKSIVADEPDLHKAYLEAVNVA